MSVPLSVLQNALDHPPDAFHMLQHYRDPYLFVMAGDEVGEQLRQRRTLRRRVVPLEHRPHLANQLECFDGAGIGQLSLRFISPRMFCNVSRSIARTSGGNSLGSVTKEPSPATAFSRTRIFASCR